MCKKLNPFILCVLLACIAISSCKKDGNSPGNQDGSSTADVYLAGFDNGYVVYWKNGKEVTLSSTTGYNGNGYGIAVSGNNIYSVGYVDQSALCWKNDSAIHLNDINFDNAQAQAITVSGNDIYIAGFVYAANKNQACYWKNGVKNVLSYVGDVGSVNGIAVSGNDVYAAGIIGDSAVLWKNGVSTNLGRGAAFSVSVVGNDVYVGGASYGNTHDGVYWKNGVKTTLSTNDACVAGVGVIGTDVYAVGYENSIVPFYWKNGTKTALGDAGWYGKATGICINGSDVYISGWVSKPSGDGNQAAWWKNGIINKVGQHPAGVAGITLWANAIAVVQK